MPNSSVFCLFQSFIFTVFQNPMKANLNIMATPSSSLGSIGSAFTSYISRTQTKYNNNDEKFEDILFAKFEFWNNNLFLLLGYQHGFQVWAIDPFQNDIVERISLRNNLKRIISIDLLNSPISSNDQQLKNRPLLVALEATVGELDKIPTTKAYIYSLKSLEFIHTIEFGQKEYETVRSSSQYICFRSSDSLVLYSATDFSLLYSFNDVWDSPNTGLPVFDVASRSISYTTSLSLQKDEETLFQMDQDKTTLATDLAVKAAKDIVGGVSMVGGMGYNAIQNYLVGDKGISDEVPRNNVQDGVIIIKRLGKTGSKDVQTIAHFKPHRHAVAHLVYNSSQTILFTASTNGTTIYGWSLLNSFGKSKSQPTCVYKLSRGYTSAIITHIQPSFDERWVSCTTSRGTTHLYQIEPQSTNIPQGQVQHIRINSRNSIQVIKSLLSNEQTQETLSSSPIHVRLSSSLDNATADLGYDDVFIDAYKNTHMATFFPSIMNQSKNVNDLLHKRFPILTWDPFGKLSLVYIDTSQYLDQSNGFNIPGVSGISKSKSSSETLEIKWKSNITNVSEWSIGRNINWGEHQEKFVEEVVHMPEDDKFTWPSKIELITAIPLSVTIWKRPQCTMETFELKDKDGLAIGTPIPIGKQHPTPYGQPNNMVPINDTLIDGLQSAMETILAPPESKHAMIESFYQTDEGFHLVASSFTPPMAAKSSILSNAWDAAKRSFRRANVDNNGIQDSNSDTSALDERTTQEP
ncbi:hypothetical protein BC833DRAFT_5927 [Globomyces pollinis-pini]|nr:hypothetical protein BC833DRAFT_5927 [Globomyces pollinis-pini]